MKVRNMVQGGAIVALSLGLASLGTGMGLTAKKSTTTTAQPGLLVGGSGGGATGSTSFSPSYVYEVYQTMQGSQESIGITLCNDLNEGSTIDNNCINNLAPAIGNEVDYYIQSLNIEPGVTISYNAAGSVSFTIFTG
ncbi:hypothetical protein [Ferrimicrobium acidiphilum]|uniref:Uncharacterized protein n=1 Tax=Ferrimicrobium acidiphilum DSM 19497 TaxID=1121877 RepID=A0A0D8FTT6_9ACTN|nr:hypothetical protein [Ferrimicrobium acidiphilum]KJE75667.1 hypothetical protein FEAC_26270 [Ferrimicrobium acidiphilum DSM 19497]